MKNLWQRCKNHCALSSVLLGCDWQQKANQLTLSTASTLLLTHLLQNYSNVQWKLPVVTGGLSPFVLRNVLAFIEEPCSTAHAG